MPTDREAAIQAFAELISFLYRGEVRAAVVAPGVILTGTTWLHDLLQSSVYRPTPDGPLVIPEVNWWCRERGVWILPSRASTGLRSLLR